MAGVKKSNAANFKLTIEMVPKPLANQSLNRQLKKHHWDKIREQQRARYNYRCNVCSVAPGKGRLHCHEVWDYNEAMRVQKLQDFVMLCDLCHRTKHGVWIKHLADGFFIKQANLTDNLATWRRMRECADFRYREMLSYANVEQDPKALQALERQRNAIMPCEHFLRVNGCTIETAEKYVRHTVKEWRRRSRYAWLTDYGEHNESVLGLQNKHMEL